MRRKFFFPCGGFLAAALLLSALVARPASAQQNPFCRPVGEALAAGEIELTLKANHQEFYNEPLDYIVRSIAGERIEFCFPAGLILESESGSYQDLVLTRTEEIALEPGGTARGVLAAMCANLDRSAPSIGEGFRVGGMADSRLLRVIQAIETRSAQGRIGAQMAVWAVTDGLSLEDLEDAGGSESAEMLRTIAPLLCLVSEELELSQEILQDADVGITLFEGDPEAALEYCREIGMPTNIDDFLQAAGRVGLLTLVFACCGTGLCGAVGVGLIAGVVVLIRRR